MVWAEQLAAQFHGLFAAGQTLKVQPETVVGTADRVQEGGADLGLFGELALDPLRPALQRLLNGDLATSAGIPRVGDLEDLDHEVGHPTRGRRLAPCALRRAGGPHRFHTETGAQRQEHDPDGGDDCPLPAASGRIGDPAQALGHRHRARPVLREQRLELFDELRDPGVHPVDLCALTPLCHPDQLLERGVGVAGGFLGEQLLQHQTERVHVTRCSHRLALRLLRAHVARSADHHPELGHGQCVGRGCGALRELPHRHS